MVDLTCVIIILDVWTVHSGTVYGLSRGLISGDDKALLSPLGTNKVSSISPVFINSNHNVPKIPVNMSLPACSPKLSSKPPPLQKYPMPPKVLSPSGSSGRKRRLAPLIPPIIPPLPFLPLPLLPLLPPPILPLPLLPNLLNPLKPLRVPILKRQTSLDKILKSAKKMTPIKLPDLSEKTKILKKLLDLKKKGSLTTAEFIRFRKLLLE